jgi:hypothetical protein
MLERLACCAKSRDLKNLSWHEDTFESPMIFNACLIERSGIYNFKIWQYVDINLTIFSKHILYILKTAHKNAQNELLFLFKRLLGFF